MNEREVLGKNIRRYREYRGLKKEELADKIKVGAILGHSNRMTTLIYSHTDKNKMQEAVKKLEDYD